MGTKAGIYGFLERKTIEYHLVTAKAKLQQREHYKITKYLEASLSREYNFLQRTEWDKYPDRILQDMHEGLIAHGHGLESHSLQISDAVMKDLTHKGQQEITLPDGSKEIAVVY